jgi:SAM-dependent methyltransferase
MMVGDPATFFNSIASRYDRVYALPAADSRRRMRRVLAELPPPPARVLDLGVGTGREIAALLDAGHALTGVDVSSEMLVRCARRARPIRLLCLNFWRSPLSFDESSFDAVIALHGTLAHPPDERALTRLARELARIVRPGGKFVAEVPSPAWLDRIGSLPQGGDRRVQRTGRRTCVYEDLIVGARIEATLADESEWLAALQPDWLPRVEPIDEVEWLVIAQRV